MALVECNPVYPSRRRYEPLFPYFASLSTAFRVVSDAYVTDDSGTGVVHQVGGAQPPWHSCNRRL